MLTGKEKKSFYDIKRFFDSVSNAETIKILIRKSYGILQNELFDHVKEGDIKEEINEGDENNLDVRCHLDYKTGEYFEKIKNRLNVKKAATTLRKIILIYAEYLNLDPLEPLQPKEVSSQ